MAGAKGSWWEPVRDDRWGDLEVAEEIVTLVVISYWELSGAGGI